MSRPPRGSIPPNTASNFPPGTPYEYVRATCDESYRKARRRLTRVKELAKEALQQSGEFKAVEPPDKEKKP